ncbi:MAG: Gfo/Idh/MocA family oxidoreductase [Actinomycetota bacterium]
MTETVRIGFVGCGLIARSHARGLSTVDGVEIGPVHDTDPERAAAFARSAGGTARPVPDAATVIAEAEAVYVCTWTSEHPPLVVAAAEAGKPVFCEKPLAVDLAGVEAMTTAVTEAGIVNQVGLVLRHSPAFRRLRQLSGEPAAGALMSIVFRDDQYLPTQGMYGSTWRGDRTKAGAGTLLEHSIHDLDLLRWLLGPIETVTAHTSAHHGLDGIEDQATVLLRAASGATATLTSIWHEVLSRPSQRRVEVFHRDRMLTLAGDWSGPVTSETPDGVRTEEQGEALTAAAAAADGLGVNPDADFVVAVRGGGPAYPDFSLAAEAHRLCDAAYRSAADGGTTLGV